MDYVGIDIGSTAVQSIEYWLFSSVYFIAIIFLTVQWNKFHSGVHQMPK